jgi:hypothetical protein
MHLVQSFPNRSRARLHPLALALSASLAFASSHVESRASLRAGGASRITVDNCDDSGPGSLRAAVASAVSGDFIDFAPSTPCSVVSLTSGPVVIANGVDGLPLAELAIYATVQTPVTIDGGGLDRVFVQDAGNDAVLRLGDLTVAHGKSDASGGCIFASGSVLLSGVEVSSCVAGTASGDTTSGGPAIRGGALYARESAFLVDSVITANRVYGGASYAYGGGIFAGSVLHAENSTITNNVALSTGGAAYGGGLAAGDRSAYIESTVTLLSTLVSSNTSDSRCSFCGSRGGGVWTYGNTTSTGGRIEGNTASSPYGYGTGGGLYFNARSNAPPVGATANGTQFHCNSADLGGGIAAGGDLVISGAILDCNIATNDGGAIELFGGDLAMSGSSIVGNLAMGRGGGIFVFGYGDAAITNSTISGNVATDGGALGNTYGTLHLANATISDNQAFSHGGGIYFRYPYYAIDLKSTIVAGNRSGSGTTVPEDLWPPGMTVTGSHDLVVAASGVSLPADTLDVDPLLQTLTMNGGATLTQALGDGSPAIDAGDNPLDLATDQRGDGFVRVYGSAADIGAFEVQPGAPADRIFANGFDP